MQRLRNGAKRRRTRRARKQAAKRLLPNKPLLVSALCGVAIAGYLTVASLVNAHPAWCAEGSSCDVVQTSRFAFILGLPIAAWGLVLYGALAAIASFLQNAALHSRLALALSGMGVAVSAYLTAVSILELGATCAWCIASLGIVMTCFGVAVAQAIRTSRGSIGREMAAVAVGSAFLVAALSAYFAQQLDRADEPAKLRRLALHLRATGARFYGASWCHTCASQKKIFGDAASLLPYVECAPQGRTGPKLPACEGIKRYPTWVIGERRYEGLVNPDDLAIYSQLSGAVPLRSEERVNE